MTEQFTAEQSGVRVPEGASTPSLFVGGEVAGAAAALELRLVLDVVAGHAAGPAGAARVRARRPTANGSAARLDLERVREVLLLVERGESIDVPPVPDIEPALRRLRVAGSVLSGPELVGIERTLVAGRIARSELARVAREAPSVEPLLVPLPDPAVGRRLTDSLEPDGELKDSASPKLARARRAIHEARERLIRKLQSVLEGLDPQAVPSGAQVTVRGDRYVIPVRRDSRARPQGIIHDESASQSTLFVEPTDAIEFGNQLRTAVADADREALAVLRELTERCRPEREPIERLHEMCVAADDLLARVRYANAVSAAVPALGSPRLVLRGARHPLLLERGVPVVPFDVTLEAGERTLLVSGPNAGGKTVLLKTVGLAALLAQSGIVPPLGPGSELPLFDRVYADIGDHQSLAADLSTFSAHVAALKEILDHAGPGTLVLLDEVGSGTDPTEGAALARAALVELTRRGALAIATTHLGALKTLAGDVPGVVNGSLDFDADALRPTFRFVKGVPGRSYGLAIAERLGLSGPVLEAARAQVPDREQALDELLGQVENRARELEERERELTARLAALEAREAAAAASGREQAERERVLSRREREAERVAHREARKHLLEARQTVEEAIRLARADAAAAAEARRLVEAAVREETSALDRVADALEPAGAGPQVEPGQRVRLPNGSMGRVVDRRADGRARVALGAVTLVVPVAELSVVAPGEPAPVRAPRGDEVPPPDAPGEIDLRGFTGDEAHAATIAALDAAILADRATVRIIHGMGTGVVRDRVRRVLSGDPRVRRFAFAPRHQGGTGVTIAELGA